MINWHKMGLDGRLSEGHPSATPTSGILIEFEIRLMFEMLWFKMCSADHNINRHTSRQWRVQNFVVIEGICNEKEHYKFYLNFKLIEISLAGRATDHIPLWINKMPSLIFFALKFDELTEKMTCFNQVIVVWDDFLFSVRFHRHVCICFVSHIETINGSVGHRKLGPGDMYRM